MKDKPMVYSPQFQDEPMECYYVLNIKSSRVVKDVTQDFLSKIVHYDNVLTLSNFGMYDTLKEAKVARREQGGIILKGIK